MRYDASEDQQLLRETTRRFLEARSPVSEVRRLMEDPVGFDPRVWREGAQLGIGEAEAAQRLTAPS